MRIAHICLAAFYIDGYGYQENILPRIHRKQGHDVEIIASTETYVDKTTLGYVEPSSYTNEDDIVVHRLPYSSWVPPIIRPKIRAYEGLTEKLEAFGPDLIFLHDIQFWDILKVAKFSRTHGIRVHADSHTDYVNSAKGFISRHILHGVYYRALARRADRAIRKYFPTLPARAIFLQGMYGLKKDKMELLPFGFDDTSVIDVDRLATREKVRRELGISSDEVVIITGGKLDHRKNIHVLVDRFSKMRGGGALKKVHLLVFGSPDQEVSEKLSALTIDENVHFLGWIAPQQLYRYFWSADLAFFPGTHSVVWEEAIGHGLATVFHRWDGMEHLQLGGNTLFIDDARPGTLDRTLEDLTKDEGYLIRQMTLESEAKGPKSFSFSKIAIKAIE